VSHDEIGPAVMIEVGDHDVGGLIAGGVPDVGAGEKR